MRNTWPFVALVLAAPFALVFLGTACPPQYPAGQPAAATADPALCEPCPPASACAEPLAPTSGGEVPAASSGGETGPTTGG